MDFKKEIDKERKKVNTNPTEKEIKAGNYKKGHVSINGFQITIENPKGSYRKGKDRNGKEWKTYMHNDYGYFTKTVGKDGDAIDVFLGNNLKSNKVFAIDQKINGKFDETKVMLFFSNQKQAEDAYLSNYEKGWKGLWKITEVNIDQFKEWLYDGHRQNKPFFQYKEIKFNKKYMKLKINEDVMSNMCAMAGVQDTDDEATKQKKLQAFMCKKFGGGKAKPLEKGYDKKQGFMTNAMKSNVNEARISEIIREFLKEELEK